MTSSSSSNTNDKSNHHPRLQPHDGTRRRKVLESLARSPPSTESPPPLGWRSWNLYGAQVNQELLQGIMDGIKHRQHLDPTTGTWSSLCDLGYCNVGLDDGWQQCKSHAAAMHYHDSEGRPVVDTKRFPNLKALTDHAHDLGLTAGWYHNNCICADHCRNAQECEMQIQQDARAIVEYGFDAVKLDGCGGEMDLHMFDRYLRQYAAEAAKESHHHHHRGNNPNPIQIENCHWGRDVPKRIKKNNDKDDSNHEDEDDDIDCPYAFYRTSGDIRPNYQSVVHNLKSVEKFRRKKLSRPGCWAYPDMLQVGVHHDWTGAPGLNPAETRTHFGAWAIVSSPLILSHDVNNDTLSAELWPLIGNHEVLDVNQAYFGDSGGVFYAAKETVELGQIEGFQAFPGVPDAPDKYLVTAPAFQFLSKPIAKNKVAVLLMNSGKETRDLVLSLDEVPGINCVNGCRVRDIWKHENLGIFGGYWSVSVDSHDAAFVVLEETVDMAVASCQLVTLTIVAFCTAILITLTLRRRPPGARMSSSQGVYEKAETEDKDSIQLQETNLHLRGNGSGKST